MPIRIAEARVGVKRHSGGVYIEDEQERLLWLHADLVACDRSFVEQVRQRVENQCGIPGSRVLLVATHTN